MKWLIFYPLAVLLGALRARQTWPTRARPFRALIEQQTTLRDIPTRVLLAWIDLESGFRPRAYNPEGAAAMERWACAVAADPRWRDNPDWWKAKDVCQGLREQMPRRALLPYWTFGSAGLMQVSGITARERGELPYQAPNSVLFDPACNIAVGARVIASLRDDLYRGRVHLDDHEWARVRAAYAGGVEILRHPEAARPLERRFLDRLRRF